MKIDFVPHQNSRDIRIPIFFQVFHPIIDTLKKVKVFFYEWKISTVIRIFIRDIKNKHDPVHTFVIN